ncbi:MAG: entericidin A/B family lipoprotein, partial [Novosphingobium sp.]
SFSQRSNRRRGRPALGRNRDMIRTIIMALALGGVALSTTACNTVKGAGEDIQSVGEAGDRAI